MIKHVEKHFLLSMVLFSVLLISCLYSSLAPSVYAAEETVQEKGLAILNDVVGLDLTKYAIITNERQQADQESYRGVIPKKSVDYKLTYGGSELRVLCTFADKKLQMLHALEDKGLPILNQSLTNSLEMAKTFLSNYQMYTADSLFGELESTLDDVEAEKNATVVSGNMKLEVTDNSEYNTTTFKWTYTFNGVTAPSKFVALGFKNGLLSYFVDNWQFHNVGSTTVKLSKEEAIDIALKTAEAHSWSLKLDDDAFETKNFNSSNVCWTALIFDDSVKTDEARSEDRLTLYPVWRVGIQLNKWYGNLYGIQVDVWADTKEVRCVQEAWSPMLPFAEEAAGQVSADAESLNCQASVVAEKALDSSIWVTLSIFGAFSIGSSTVWMNRKKLKSYPLPKLRSLKACGILLFAMLSITIFVPFVAVNATQTKAAVIWGSRSTGATDPQSWRKHWEEVYLQNITAKYYRDLFINCGYNAAFNDTGLGSLKTAIVNRMDYMNNTYDSIAVVDFDHGVGRIDYSLGLGEFHYMFEDDRGTITGPWNGTHTPEPQNGVYDIDVYNNISAGKVSLAFINTCLSANVTNWIYTDENNVTYSVGQGLLGEPPNQRAQGMPFAWTHRTVADIDEPWFNIAENMSINGTREPDLGSQCYIGFSYGSASLRQQIPYPSGTYQYYNWTNAFFYYLLEWQMSVHDALDHASQELWGTYFSYPSCPLQNFTACWWKYQDEDSTMPGSKMEVYGNGRIRPFNPFQNILSISAVPYGTTNPSPGDYYYDFDTTSVQVSAESYDHYAFDFWFLDREFYSRNETITVPMDGNHELSAVFTYKPEFFVDDFNDGYMDPFLWEKLQANGGIATETAGQLRVAIPSGSGWAQAGYVTKHTHDLEEATVTVQVPEFNSLDEMALQIGNTKTTDSDPFNQNNWYRILKARGDSKVYMQNKIGTVMSNKAILDWANATGQLTISVSTGSIALYENGILRYSEPFALPSYNCYIYIFTSTDRSTSSGTDGFDNFAVNPTSAFKDDFNDGNYNGWTASQGSWTASNGKLAAQQGNSLIRTNQQFTTNRHVRAEVRTITAGDDSWEVGWVMVKYVDASNMIYSLLHTNGGVELAIIKNGQKIMRFGSSQLSPYNVNAIDVSIIGTKAMVWINGQLYIDTSHDWFDDFGGYTACWTENSLAEFDNIVVLDE